MHTFGQTLQILKQFSIFLLSSDEMKFISSSGGAENFFANVSIGYAQGMYYLSSSGLACKVGKQAYERCEKLRHK